MWRTDTKGATRAGLGLALVVWAAAAQVVPQPAGPDWRQIGDTSIELLLASPATGPVKAVWFSSEGSRLHAQTESGQVFETADFETWNLSNAKPPVLPQVEIGVARLPEPGARVVRPPADPGRVYALASHLHRSEDEGSTWTDLTGYGDSSVIGNGVDDLAVSPENPDHLVVANKYGVWHSQDGGLSWSGLNQTLPNLPVSRILRAPEGPNGIQIFADGFGPVELNAGRSRQWLPVSGTGVEAEQQARRSYGEVIGATVTAAAGAGDMLYAGTSDGRLFVSTDRGRSWVPTQAPAAGPVTALWVNGDEPRVALATLGGKGTRVLRTTNGGVFWDDLTANLPDATARAVTADRSSGAIYVATDRGAFFTRGDLFNPAPATAWVALTGNLPAAAVTDVKLGAGGNQLYVALDGYGVFAAPTPRRPGILRWLNAADFSGRAAAPGSLVSILGGRVERAQAGNLQFPVLAASESESQIQVPYEAAGPSVPVAVEAADTRSTLILPIQDVSPAIFVDRDGVPMLLDGDSGLMLNAGNTARSNARIQILATGLGKVRPNWPSGLPAPLENPPAAIAPVRVYLDRTPLPVTRAVLAPGYIGFYVVEAQLPAIVNFGPAELYITAGDQESNRVQVYLEP